MHRIFFPPVCGVVVFLTMGGCGARPAAAIKNDEKLSASQPGAEAASSLADSENDHVAAAPVGAAVQAVSEGDAHGEAEAAAIEPSIVTVLNSDPAERQPLRWKFAPGDVVRFETALADQVSLGEQRLENERIVRFRWTVLEVNPDGLATVAISFERVRVRLASPPVDYDSDEDRPDRELPDDDLARAELLAARGLLHSVMLLQASDRGGCTAAFGSEGVPSASQFTPGDFPALPEEPVGVGDTWSLPIEVRDAAQQSSGLSEHVVKSVQSAGGRNVLVLECRTVMKPHGGPATTGLVEQAPVMTVNRFDAATGRFLSRTIRGQLTFKTESGVVAQRG